MNKVNKWIFIDACHSGGFWGNDNPGDTGDLEKLKDIAMMASATEDGYGTYLGSDIFRFNRDYGKSAFEIHLREGLSLNSDGHANCDTSPEDGIVTFDEIHKWMKDEVTDLNWLNGLTVRKNDIGDDVIFSIDDWNPVCNKSDDFGGVLCSVDPNEPRANISGDNIGYRGKPISFDASNSSSPNGEIVKYEWDWNGDGIYEEETSDPIIEHIYNDIHEGIVVLKITDVEDMDDTTSISVNILNNPPIAEAGGSMDVEIDSDCLATVTLDGSGSYDPDGDQLTYTWIWNPSEADVSVLLPYDMTSFSKDGFILTGVNPTVDLPVGNYTFQLVVNDGTDNSEVDTVEVNVVETTPPNISVSVNPTTLWPPNHKMVCVTPKVTVTDNCDPNPKIKLISITMNEDDKTNTYDPNFDTSINIGNTGGDIQIDKNGNIYLRAERSGTSTNGRVYTIIYSATDASGNCSTASATVKVPHNQ